MIFLKWLERCIVEVNHDFGNREQSHSYDSATNQVTLGNYVALILCFLFCEMVMVILTFQGWFED